VAASANPAAAWLGTWTIYGGAAQLAVLDVLAQGTGWLGAALVGLLVNARLTAYAVDMAPQWRSAPRHHRVAAAVMLTDAPWALARGRTRGHPGFYLGAGLTLFLAWPLLVTVGVLTAGWLHALPVAGLLSALTLGAVVVTQLRQRPVCLAVAAASASAVVTASLGAGSALAVAAAAGVLAGTFAERRS
jgi:predicted branched-subunit amino acid permease